MKISSRFLTAATIATMTLAACQKTEPVQPTQPVHKDITTIARCGTSDANPGYPGYPSGATFCSAGVTQTLYTSQNVNVGTVTINKDFTTGIVYVTYVTAGYWYLSSLNLYVNEQDSCNIPLNCYGAPAPGQFPFSAGISPVHVYTFPVSGLTGNCFCVAAQATVKKISNGCVWQTQTAWANGVRINSCYWPTKFDACLVSCDGGGDNMLH